MVDYAHNGNFDPSEYTRSRRLCRKLNGIEKFDVNHGSGNSGPSIAKVDETSTISYDRFTMYQHQFEIG